MAENLEISDFGSAYKYLCSQGGTDKIVDGQKLKITCEPGFVGGLDNSALVRVEVSDDKEFQEILVSPIEGAYRFMWVSSREPVIPKVRLLDGGEIPHPYVYVDMDRGKLFANRIGGHGFPGEPTREEQIKICFERGITLAQRLQELLNQQEKSDPIEYYI